MPEAGVVVLVVSSLKFHQVVYLSDLIVLRCGVGGFSGIRWKPGGHQSSVSAR